MAIEHALDWTVKAQEQAERKVLALAEHGEGMFYHASRNGTYPPTTAEWWTSGFWPGMLWLVYQRSGDPTLAARATAAEDELARVIGDERFAELHHDVGFQFLPTAVMRYLLTGDPTARRRGLLAAALLMSRFNPASGALEAWNGPTNRGKVIIDTMMNMRLLAAGSDLSSLRPFRRDDLG